MTLRIPTMIRDSGNAAADVRRQPDRRRAHPHTLPRNPSGKVLKHVLREPHWADLDRAVH